MKEVYAAIEEAEQRYVRGELAESQALLERALTEAVSDEARGALHRALAVHWARRLQYRKTNHHERASVEALAQAPGGAPLGAALVEYDAGVKHFTDAGTEPTRALEHLRGARRSLLAALSIEHPFVQQATSTLAGRLRDVPEASAERLALHRELLGVCERLYGPAHPLTLDQLVAVGWLQRSLGDPLGGLADLERAFDGFFTGPWPHKAEKLLASLARLCAEVGEPERIAPRERAILARNPALSLVVRALRLERMSPATRWAFAAGAVRHAAEHVPSMTTRVSELVAALEHGAGDVLRAQLEEARRAHVEESAEELLLRAVFSLWLLQSDARGEHAVDAASFALDALDVAVAAQEEAWQRAHFASLWGT